LFAERAAIFERAPSALNSGEPAGPDPGDELLALKEQRGNDRWHLRRGA